MLLLSWGYLETGLLVLIAMIAFVCLIYLHNMLGILTKWEERELTKPQQREMWDRIGKQERHE